MDIVICTGGVSRCVERKHDGGIRVRENGIREDGEIFDSIKKGIQ